MPNRSAHGFLLDLDDRPLNLIVFRRDGDVRVFVNACPHVGTPLEIFPGRFMTRDGRHLLCSTHGARFRPEDGLCIAGPCKGKYLSALPCFNRDGTVWLSSGDAAI